MFGKARALRVRARRVGSLPDAQTFCCRCQQILLGDGLILVSTRHPLYFGWRELMCKLIDFAEPIIWVCQAQVDNFDFVVHAVSLKASDGELELVVASVSEGDCVVLEIAFICVDLLSVSGFRQPVNFIHCGHVVGRESHAVLRFIHYL